jgi:hypothetical protein
VIKMMDYDYLGRIYVIKMMGYDFFGWLRGFGLFFNRGHHTNHVIMDIILIT